MCDATKAINNHFFFNLLWLISLYRWQKPVAIKCHLDVVLFWSNWRIGSLFAIKRGHKINDDFEPHKFDRQRSLFCNTIRTKAKLYQMSGSWTKVTKSNIYRKNWNGLQKEQGRSLVDRRSRSIGFRFSGLRNGVAHLTRIRLDRDRREQYVY